MVVLSFTSLGSRFLTNKISSFKATRHFRMIFLVNATHVGYQVNFLTFCTIFGLLDTYQDILFVFESTKILQHIGTYQ